MHNCRYNNWESKPEFLAYIDIGMKKKEMKKEWKFWESTKVEYFIIEILYAFQSISFN